MCTLLTPTPTPSIPPPSTLCICIQHPRVHPRCPCPRHPLMRRRHGSTRGYAHSEDLEPRVRRSRAMDRRTAGVATRALQPPLQLIPSFRRPCAFSTHSDRPETRQECRVQVVRCAHSKSERVIAWIALNITKTTLVVCKTLTARAEIGRAHV